MPYEVRKDKDKFCVFNTDTNAKKGCSDTKEQAVAHLKALYAAEAEMSALEALAILEEDEEAFLGDNYEFADTMTEHPWSGPIVFEEILTGDNRVFKTNSINWQDETLPWPLRWQKASGQGHAGSVPVGRVDRIQRMEDGSIHGFGVVIPELSEEAAEYLRILEAGVGGGVSVDGDSAQFEIQEQESGQPRVEFSSMRLRALSAVDIPAFNGARIHLVGSNPETTQEAEVFDAENPVSTEVVPEAVIQVQEIIDLREELAKKKAKKSKKYGWSIDASLTAAAIPVLPSTDAFVDPVFDGPTPLTVTPDGRVFGHLALFNTCHIGFPGTCVKPPKGSKYQYFHTGQIETAEGDLVDCGKLTFKTGHADMNASPRIAADHYDNTGTVAADVRAGEDKFGIWVVGALRPHLSDEDIRAFRCAPLSGDWRRIAGRLELVGALGVNTPGFPVPRVRALVASGETETLFTFLEDDDEEFIVSNYELNLRLDKKVDLASKVSKFLGEEVDENAPEGKIEEEVSSFTKSEIKARANNYTKNQLFADLKLVRELLDDPEEKMPKKVRDGLEELYKAFIKIDEGGKKFSTSGYDLAVIDASGLEIEEWEAELEFSGLAVEEFYNQCHDENGRFCPGTDGPGRVRDNVAKGRHDIPGNLHLPGQGGKAAGDPSHRHTAPYTRTPSTGGPTTPPTTTAPKHPSAPSTGGGGATVNPRTYENFRNTRRRSAQWFAASVISAAALSSPASGILTGIASAAGLGILANPLTLALIFGTGAAYGFKNAAAARRHRTDYNHQVDRKLRVDKANEQADRIRKRALNS